MIDLKTKGYTVIPNFLSEDEIAVFLADYNSAKSSNIDSHPEYVTQVNLNLPKEVLFSKLTEVSKASGLKVDMLILGGLYTSTSSMNMQWHQDHESYYLTQQLYDYLNFYIILEKEDPLQSGLSVIPFDRLAEVLPDHVDQFLNSGAKRLEPDGDTTRVWDDENGEEWTLPVNINSIMDSPKLSAGDLLLVRGDVIHKTQDASTNRIALSIRCGDSSSPISLKKLQQGCQYKQNWIKNYKFELAFENEKIEIMPMLQFYSRILPGKHTSKFYCLME